MAQSMENMIVLSIVSLLLPPAWVLIGKFQEQPQMVDQLLSATQWRQDSLREDTILFQITVIIPKAELTEQLVLKMIALYSDHIFC